MHGKKESRTSASSCAWDSISVCVDFFLLRNSFGSFRFSFLARMFIFQWFHSLHLFSAATQSRNQVTKIHLRASDAEYEKKSTKRYTWCYIRTAITFTVFKPDVGRLLFAKACCVAHKYVRHTPTEMKFLNQIMFILYISFRQSEKESINGKCRKKCNRRKKNQNKSSPY